MKRLFALVSIILITAITAVASDEHHANAEATEHEASGHHEFKNEFSLFVGATDKKGHDSELTFALEYVREVAPGWGIGGIYEHVGGDLRNRPRRQARPPRTRAPRR